MLQKSTSESAIRLALRRWEAAEALGISERLLQKETNEGRIPACRIGGTIVYSIDVLRDYLRANSEQVDPGASES